MNYKPLKRVWYGLAVTTTAAMMMTGGVNAAKPSGASNSYYSSAQKLIAKRDYKGAIIQLKNALQADPDDLSVRILLGHTYLKSGDAASAAKELLRAQKNGARGRFILVPLGEAFLRLGLYGRILKDIDTTGQDDETGAKINIIRGEAQLAIQENLEAEKYFVSALKILPNNERALIGVARLKLGMGDFTAAEQYSNWALDANAGNSDVWFLKAEIARLRRDLKKALANYNKALDLSPNSTRALQGRAALLIALGRHNDAEPDITKVRKLKPNAARAAYLHFLILKNRGEAKKAREALLEADLLLQSYSGKASLTHLPTMLLSGIVSYFLHKEDAALEHLKRYLRRIPHHDGAIRIVAAITLKRGETAEALRLLEPIAPYLTKDVDFLKQYSDALIRSQRYDEAVETLDAATALTKPGSSVIYHLAALYMAARRDDRAIDLLKAGIANDSHALRPVLMLTTLYMRQNKFEIALKTIGTVLQKHPDSPAVHDLAGGAHLGLSNIADARASFQNAIESNPGYLPAFFNLAKLEGGVGNYAAARKHFATILEKDPRNSDVMFMLARLHRSENDNAGAERWLRMAQETSRDKKRASMGLFELYLETGAFDKALFLAQQLHQEDPENLDYLAALGRAQ